MEEILLAMKERLPPMEERLSAMEERPPAMDETVCHGGETGDHEGETACHGGETACHGGEETTCMEGPASGGGLLIRRNCNSQTLLLPVVITVPIWKPDGTVRLRLNFKNIKVVTTPDPYLMPRVDDMLTQSGNAKFLTKMDLNNYSIRSHFGKKISARKAWINSGGPLYSTGRGDARTSLQLERLR